MSAGPKRVPRIDDLSVMGAENSVRSASRSLSGTAQFRFSQAFAIFQYHASPYRSGGSRGRAVRAFTRRRLRCQDVPGALVYMGVSWRYRVEGGLSLSEG